MTTLTERAFSIFAPAVAVIVAAVFAFAGMFRKRRTRGAAGVATTTAALVAVLVVGMEWAPSAYSQTTASNAPPAAVSATPTASAEPQAEEERIVPGESFFVLTLVAAVFGGMLIVLARWRRRRSRSPQTP